MVKRRFEIDAESLPDLPGMMLVTIEALKDLGGSATIQELDEKVIELEGVTEAEQAFTMPDENRPSSPAAAAAAWMRRAICDPDNPNTLASSGASWQMVARAALGGLSLFFTGDSPRCSLSLAYSCNTGLGKV